MVGPRVCFKNFSSKNKFECLVDLFYFDTLCVVHFIIGKQKTFYSIKFKIKKIFFDKFAVGFLSELTPLRH